MSITSSRTYLSLILLSLCFWTSNASAVTKQVCPKDKIIEYAKNNANQKLTRGFTVKGWQQFHLQRVLDIQ